MSETCGHLDQIEVLDLPDPVAGCEECLATGDVWVHLRMCLTCGHIGCCDSSPNRHASRHAGERWAWCYVDRVAFLPGEDAAG
jgi:hypothetical protein